MQNVIKDDALPKYDRTNMCFVLINEKEESSKVSSTFLSVNQIMWRSSLSSLSLLKKGRRRRRRRRRREGVKGERKWYLPLSMLLLL
jgi:hypothetical protein